ATKFTTNCATKWKEVLDRLRQKSTIDANISARHEAAGFMAGQENRGANQLVRLAKAAHRCMAEDRFRARRRRTVVIEKQFAILFGREKTRRNRIDPHPFSRPFAREKLRQAQHRGFRG